MDSMAQEIFDVVRPYLLWIAIFCAGIVIFCAGIVILICWKLQRRR